MIECWAIQIGGFNAIVDHHGMLICCAPEIASLEHRSINEVFNKYKNRTSFKRIKKVPYPLIVKDDVYIEMRKQNAAIEYLKQKFDCEIY